MLFVNIKSIFRNSTLKYTFRVKLRNILLIIKQIKKNIAPKKLHSHAY